MRENPSPSTILALRADHICRGDVLLSRGSQKISSTIAMVSGGEFSHAALCANNILILESSGDDVVGFSRLKAIGRVRMSNSLVSLRTPPGEPLELELLRHPDLAGLEPEKFDEALFQELEASYGTDYSEMIRLAGAAADDWSRPFVMGALSLLDFKYGTSGVHGPFCSELVARVFQRLNLSLFDTERSPDSTSPNHLAASKLLVVAGAVVRISTTEIVPPTEADAALDGVWPVGRDPIATAMRKVRESDGVLDDINDGIERTRALTRVWSIGLAGGFAQFSVLLFKMVNDPSLVENRMIRRWIHIRCREGAKLAPAMRDLATGEQSDLDAVTKTLAELELFQHGVMRCKAFLSLAAIRMRLQKRREWYFIFARWILRIRRRRICSVRSTILATRTAYLRP